jgi:hypothetical protein
MRVKGGSGYGVSIEHVFRDAVNPSLEAWLRHPCRRHPANVLYAATH